MRTQHISPANRVLALILSLIMVFSMMPSNVAIALEVSYGTVEALTPGGVASGDAANPVLTYSSAELEWVDADASIGRTNAGWYIGMRVKAPAEMTKEADFIDGEKQVVFQTLGMSGWSANQNFWENQNSDIATTETERYIDLWYFLDESRLHTGKLNGGIDYGFKVDWDMDGTFDQTFTMKIDPNGVTLKKDDSVVFPVSGSGTVSILNSDGTINSAGSITGNGSDYVKVTPAATVYEWCEATAFRPTEGWWAGIRIDVPAGTAQGQMEAAKFQIRSVGGSWSVEQLFWDEHETDSEGVHYITLWKSLNNLASETAVATTQMQFDWDNDGTYEQLVELSINSANVTLMNGEKQVYPVERVNLSLVVNGNGKINVDGTDYSTDTVSVVKGEDVAITLNPGDSHTRVSEIKLNDVVISASEIPAKFAEDAKLEVTYVTEYTVSVNANPGGTVKLNGEEKTSLVAAKDATVSVDITAAKGYQIQSISIGGVAETISDTEQFHKEIAADADTDVVVVFVKVYTITVTCGENGGVTVDGNGVTSGGTVTIFEGATTATLVAEPATGYRVSQVVINDEPQNFDTHAYKHEEVLTMDKDYTVTVTFAETTYEVSIEPPVNGTVTIDDADGIVDHGGQTTVTVKADEANGYEVISVTVNGIAVTLDDNGQYTLSDIKEAKTIKATFALKNYDVVITPPTNGTVTVSPDKDTVEHGSDIVVTVTPNEGYSVGTITVNGVDVVDFSETETGITFTIENAVEAKTIAATFVQTEAAPSAITGLFNSSEALRVDGMTYIYANNGKVTFTTEKSGIRIYIKGQYLSQGGMSTQSVTFDKNTEITKIQLYYKADGEYRSYWHTVDGVSDQNTLKLVFDTTKTTVEVKPADANEHGYYNDNFDVIVNVQDTGDYSGIASVVYKVMNGATETRKGTLYPTASSGSEIAERLDALKFTVDAAVNNSDDVKVIVTVTDRAGNITTEEKSLKINTTAPVLESIEVFKEDKRTEALDGYYIERVIKLTITDRATTFNQTAATAGIKIKATNAAGTELTVLPSAITWSNDGNTHVATITFNMDANYEWSVDYTNNADKVMDKSATVISATDIYEFTVDTQAPTGKIAYNTSVWEDIVSKLTFGIWKHESMTVTVVENNDDTSPLKTVQYYKSNSAVLLSEDELDDLFAAGSFVNDPYTVNTDQKFTVYARLVDYAGNRKYISTNGLVYDNTESTITLTPDAANASGYYNKDVTIDVAVSEIVEEGKDYSGIKTIDYVVIKNGDTEHPTQSGNLYTFAVEDPTYDQLRASFGKEDADYKNIVVNAIQNNHDNIKVVVTVVDNAGKVSTKEVNLSINLGDELQANISFTDEADKIVDDRGYFDAENRTATITLIDRANSFDKDAATKGIKITALDAADDPVANAYTISDWVSVGNTHTVTITFHENANYDWSFSYTNKADNVLDVKNKLSTGDSVTPYVFTVDDEDPTGTVSTKGKTWTDIVRVLTFGLYDQKSFTFEATAEDDISPVVIQYYKSNKTTAMTATELDQVAWVDYTEAYTESSKQTKSVTMEDEETFVIYQKISDYAGNYIYLRADGTIIDRTPTNVVITAEDPNANGFYGQAYGDTVDVEVEVTDSEPYSGIKTIEYWIVKDGNEAIPTQSGILFNFANAAPTYDELVKAKTVNILVDTALNNSCNVVVHVKVTDNAGNVTEKTVALDIDITSPDISLDYNTDHARNGKYFDENRTATVVVTERTHHFDADKVVFKFTATDAKGNSLTATDADGYAIVDKDGYAVDKDGKRITDADGKEIQLYTIEWAEAVEGATADAATHTATIKYLADANYTFAVSYVDDADNTNTTVTTGDSVAPYEFTVDKTAPTGTITGTAGEENGRVTTWDSLINNLTFGFWSGKKITVTGTTDDVTSPIESVKSYKIADTDALTLDELKAITVDSWKNFTSIEILPNEQCTVYLQIIDYAGNVTYISTDGLIVDDTAPREETIAPEITVEPEQPINGLYNGDVKVSIKVTDPLTGNTFAGLKKIAYRVLNMGEVTQGTGAGDETDKPLYEFTVANPSKADLLQTWTGEIVVDSELNNSNDVVIEIYAEDNAGNTSTDKVAIKIDTTAPQIDIDYDNDNPDSGSYYKANRVATIKITERNFDPKDVKITITNTDKVIPDVPTELAHWTKAEGTEANGDGNTYTATITYAADGDYTFAIEYTDLAGWTCGNVADKTYNEEVVFAEGTQNPIEFTIDQTAPIVTVSYNNNSAQNDKYFNATRTTTITITEHNFPLNDIARVVFTQTTDRGGVIPTVSWTHNGDTHIATFNYTTDGDYTFDVAMTDLAGNASAEANYGNTVAGKDFVIDTTFEDMISQEGVENGVAYGHDAEVIPNIKISDINLQEYKVTLVGIQKDKTIDLTEDVNALLNKGTETVTGIFDIFETKQDLDGIYTLTMTSKDKAGNEDSMEIIFTVNRFGSVYVYEKFLQDLIVNGGSYIYSVDEDLIITEYNADKLVTDSLKIEVTVDGRPLEDVKFTVTPEINDTVSVGSSGWYQYKYTISKDNFKADGVYKISISSKDATGNQPENTNYEGMEMNFRVDSTKAEITSIVGLEESIINAQEVIVKYTVFDTIGLKTIKVYVNGQLVDEITDFSADMNNFNGQFALTEQSNAQSVKIVVEDMAGNITDTSSDDFTSAYAFNDSVTVSTNLFVRWYANTGLFWGSVAGFVVVAGGLGYFFIAKRKKKEEETAAK